MKGFLTMLAIAIGVSAAGIPGAILGALVIWALVPDESKAKSSAPSDAGSRNAAYYHATRFRR